MKSYKDLMITHVKDKGTYNVYLKGEKVNRKVGSFGNLKAAERYCDTIQYQIDIDDKKPVEPKCGL